MVRALRHRDEHVLFGRHPRQVGGAEVSQPQVSVGLDQAGHEGRSRPVDHGGLFHHGRAKPFGDGGDAIAFDQHGAREGGAAGAVQDLHVANQVGAHARSSPESSRSHASRAIAGTVSVAAFRVSSAPRGLTSPQRSGTIGGRERSMIDPLHAFDGIMRRLSLPGKPGGPLAGTSFVVKDLYDVAGHPTGAGNPDWERTHPIPAQTAPAVRRLRDAGATLVGKSCTDELAFSLDGINVHYGTPLNPRFPDRLPGGSSSGSVSAVAAGLADFALGTDTSGSTRVPASYCGVYGFRPAHGVIPSDGVVPLSPSFDTVGWLARDARMLARSGRAVLGIDADRARSHATGGFTRIHVLAEAFDLVDEPYRGGLRDAEAMVSRAFAKTGEVQLPHGGLTGWFDVFHTIKQWEAWQVHGKWIRATNPYFADNIRANFEAASRVTDAEHRRALVDRSRVCASMERELTPESVICTPTAWAIAPLKQAPAEELAFNRKRDLALGCVAGLLGAPQVSMPVMIGPNTIGLSLIAAPGEDERLLALAESIDLEPRR